MAGSGWRGRSAAASCPTRCWVRAGRWAPGPPVALAASRVPGLQKKGKTRLMDVVTIERDENVLLMGVNRPELGNLWDLEVIQRVSRAYRQLADDADLRVGVVFGH